jgi:protoporphyrinogen oxidase
MRKKSTPVTFEDWIIQKFGRTLYEIFFKVYTEKVWGIPCSQISAEWAAQRIKGLDALEVIRNAFRGRHNRKIKTLVEEFDFPVLGAGQMYEALCSNIVRQGAELLLDSRVTSFNQQDNRINSIEIISGGKWVRITARQFFSSIPLAHFFRMLNPPDSDEINNAAGMLRYRDHITVNLLVKKRKLFPDQWIYVHSPEVQMARVANYNNFSKAMVGDENKTALSVEYFVFKDRGLWNKSDESLAQLATDELEKIGLLKKGDVEKSWVVRETEAYPMYYCGLQEYYSVIKSRINQFTNFYSIGRAGLHVYNNQDHSLMSGILAARNYLKLAGSPYVLWDINIDAEYQESMQRII